MYWVLLWLNNDAAIGNFAELPVLVDAHRQESNNSNQHKGSSTSCRQGQCRNMLSQ